MKHPIKIDGWDESLEILAKRIADMRYDKQVEFFDYLQAEYIKQYEGDSAAGRKKLAAQLLELWGSIINAKASMTAAWTISKPFMKDEL